MPTSIATSAIFWKRAAGLLLVLLVNATLDAQFTPSADSYTNSAKSSANYGSGPSLNVVSSSSSIQNSYIQFDLSSVPPGYTGANVAKATLKLFASSVTTAGSFNVNYIGGTWSESTITAGVAPAQDANIIASVPLTKANAEDYILVDVTSAVKAWVNGSKINDGIVLVANSPLNVTFESKENTSESHPPELDIVFQGPILDVTTTAGGGLTGGGTGGTVSLSLQTGCAIGQVLQWNGSAWVCSNAGGGSGTITGVTAGTGLTGGGTGGVIVLSLDTTQVPLLGSSNVFTGNQSVNGNLSATGPVSGSSFNIGGNPFAFGSSARENAFLGFAGNTTMTGGSNTATGYIALGANTTGASNSASGYAALASNATGSYNTASGLYALAANTTGGSNSASGTGALYHNQVGNLNTALGYSADVASGNLTNATAIGANAQVSQSNSLVLGSINGVNGATANTNVGIGTTTPQYALDVHGTANFTGPVTFASGQLFPGIGTITGVTAGTDLTGGGSSGNITLNLDTTKVVTGVTAGTGLTGGGTGGVPVLSLDTTHLPLLIGNNTFTGNQTVNGQVTVSSDSRAIVGTATGTASHGIEGETRDTDFYSSGVYGRATATTGSQATGVVGISDGDLGFGIKAIATGSASTAISAKANGTSSVAIQADATSTEGNTIGVKSTVASASGIAGRFENTNGTGTIISALSNGTEVLKVDATGVSALAFKDLAGNALATQGSNVFVGNQNLTGTLNVVTSSTTGVNVWGLDTVGISSSVTTGVGMRGSANNIGVLGEGLAINGGGGAVGVKGTSSSYDGVAGLFENTGGGKSLSAKAAESEIFYVDSYGVTLPSQAEFTALAGADSVPLNFATSFTKPSGGTQTDRWSIGTGTFIDDNGAVVSRLGITHANTGYGISFNADGTINFAPTQTFPGVVNSVSVLGAGLIIGGVASTPVLRLNEDYLKTQYLGLGTAKLPSNNTVFGSQTLTAAAGTALIATGDNGAISGTADKQYGIGVHGTSVAGTGVRGTTATGTGVLGVATIAGGIGGAFQNTAGGKVLSGRGSSGAENFWVDTSGNIGSRGALTIMLPSGAQAYRIANLDGLAGTTDTAGLLGIGVADPQYSQNINVAIAGLADCIFDIPPGIGDYVQASTVDAGACHGISNYPRSGQVLGRVMSGPKSNGIYTVILFGPEQIAIGDLQGDTTFTGSQVAITASGWDAGVAGSGHLAGVTGTSDAGYGVSGTATGDVGTGVHGSGYTGVAGVGTEKGVEGTAASNSGYGVIGTNTAATGTGVSGNGFIGVSGSTSRDNGNGVYGHSTSATGNGVLGTNDGYGVGVHGIGGTGVRGEGKYSGGIGVSAESILGTALAALGKTGINATATDPLSAAAVLTSTNGANLISGNTAGTTVFAVDSLGDLAATKVASPLGSFAQGAFTQGTFTNAAGPAIVAQTSADGTAAVEATAKRGIFSGTNMIGVHAAAYGAGAVGILGTASWADDAVAARFDGPVQVNGNVTQNGKLTRDGSHDMLPIAYGVFADNCAQLSWVNILCRRDDLGGGNVRYRIQVPNEALNTQTYIPVVTVVGQYAIPSVGWDQITNELLVYFFNPFTLRDSGIGIVIPFGPIGVSIDLGNLDSYQYIHTSFNIVIYKAGEWSAPPYAGITASPGTVLSGGTVTLKWNCTGGTSSSGDGFSTGGAPSGTTTDNPTCPGGTQGSCNVKYTLSCTGPYGTGTNSVVEAVLPSSN